MSGNLMLRSISSTEADLGNWSPDSKDEIYICLDVEIGFSEVEGANLFYATLATPEALKKRRPNEYLLVRNRTLVVDEYDYRRLLDAVNSVLDECSRPTWAESCSALQRYFEWEYEDYQTE